MIRWPSAPLARPPAPEVSAPAPSGDVLVEAPPAPPDPGTWVPATGGSTVVGFFAHPAMSAAPASNSTIDSILFIAISIGFLTFPASLPAKSAFVQFVRGHGN